MTKGIADALGIPHLDDILKDEEIDFKSETTKIVSPPVDVSGQITALEELDKKLKAEEGLDHGAAMDEIFDETLEHSRNLMDLGYNTDERSRRGIFEIATSMYKNALDAKNSKRDAQLKLMKLIQDQKKQDFEEMKWRAERGEHIAPGGMAAGATLVEDRNELIKRLRADAKAEAAAELTKGPDSPDHP